MKPLVIDIYHNDPVESFQEIKDAGIQAIIHQASEGSRRDQLYEHRRQAFVDLGFKWGAYHFFHGNGKAEADFFLSAAQPDENTLLALDWEPTPNGVTPSYAAARAFLERIEEKLGRKAVVYSGNVAKCAKIRSRHHRGDFLDVSLLVRSCTQDIFGDERQQVG